MTSKLKKSSIKKEGTKEEIILSVHTLIDYLEKSKWKLIDNYTVKREEFCPLYNDNCDHHSQIYLYFKAGNLVLLRHKDFLCDEYPKSFSYELEFFSYSKPVAREILKNLSTILK